MVFMSSVYMLCVWCFGVCICFVCGICVVCMCVCMYVNGGVCMHGGGSSSECVCISDGMFVAVRRFRIGFPFPAIFLLSVFHFSVGFL